MKNKKRGEKRFQNLGLTIYLVFDRILKTTNSLTSVPWSSRMGKEEEEEEEEESSP